MKLVLALSGGGFRATLFHLGVISYLRERECLSSVSNICSVSGGSVLAAHLVLNWEEYSGTDTQFMAAANRLLAFAASDLRGKIVRRYSVFGLSGLLPQFIGHGRFQVTPTSLLRWYYEKFFTIEDGGTVRPANLKDLRKVGRPDLEILTTALRAGYSCSLGTSGFTSFGAGASAAPCELLPLSDAVTASSAFPALFPALQVTNKDISSLDADGESFSDGGVFDNLGIRRGRALLSKHNADHLIISDAGRPFIKHQSMLSPRSPLRTALRATDVLYKRVGDLEETISAGVNGCAWVRITDQVSNSPLSADIQAQLRFVRTDFDRFSNPLAASLICHGYCVADKALVAASVVTAAAPKYEFPLDFVLRGNQSRVKKTVDRADQRRVHFFAFRDWFSWVQACVCMLILLLLLLKARDILTAGDQSTESLAVYQTKYSEENRRFVLEDLQLVTLDNAKYTSADVASCHYSWIIARSPAAGKDSPPVIVAIREYKFQSLRATFEVWSKATRSMLKNDLVFTRDIAGKVHYANGVDTFPPTPVPLDVISLTVFTDLISNGDFILFYNDRFDHTNDLSFDISIANQDLNYPGPFLHEIVKPWSIRKPDLSHLLFRQQPLQLTKEQLAPDAIHLLQDLSNAMMDKRGAETVFQILDKKLAAEPDGDPSAVRCRWFLGHLRELIAQGSSFDYFVSPMACRSRNELIFQYYLKPGNP